MLKYEEIRPFFSTLGVSKMSTKYWKTISDGPLLNLYITKSQTRLKKVIKAFFLGIVCMKSSSLMIIRGSRSTPTLLKILHTCL